MLTCHKRTDHRRHLPPKAVYFILCLDEFRKVPVVYRYYKSEKWLNDIMREYE